MLSLLVTFLLFCQPIYSSIRFKMNPGCIESNCTLPGNPAIFYGYQFVDTSTIHILYSSLDELTISIIETKRGHVPRLNYTALFQGNYANAISFGSIEPTSSLSLVIRRLMKFTDKNDTGLINDSDTPIQSYWLKNLATNLTSYDNDTDQPSFVLPLDDVNGLLTIDINYPGESTRDTKYPKLRSTEKSYFLNLELETKNISIKSTRFAFEFYMIQLGEEGMQSSSTKYIDDQYTPGIFNVWQVISSSAFYKSSMLWKPIVYQSIERSNSESTLMHVYDLNNTISLDQTRDQGIFRALFDWPYVSAFNLSLGRSNDKYFIHTNYSFIQLSVGLDILKPDSTDEFVALGLLISIALPFLVTLIAIILIIRRRCSRPVETTPYDRIYE